MKIEATITKHGDEYVFEATTTRKPVKRISLVVHPKTTVQGMFQDLSRELRK